MDWVRSDAELSIDIEAGLTVAENGAVLRTVALADIADVAVGERVRLVHPDGTRTDLPMTQGRAANEALTNVLWQGLREMRAQTGDYRGGQLT